MPLPYRILALAHITGARGIPPLTGANDALRGKPLRTYLLRYGRARQDFLFPNYP